MVESLIKECSILLTELKQQVHQATYPDVNQCDGLITKIKLLICRFPSLPPSFVPASPKEFIIKSTAFHQYSVGEFLETAVVYSLQKDSLEEFEMYMMQLRGFYVDSKKVLPPSEKRYGILGLYLLFLIYKNRTSDYYTELETLSIEEQKNVYIAVAVSLEQYFIDGNYFKILHTKQNVPMGIYNYFIDKMIETVRHEAARSAEKAYARIRAEDAYKLFLLNSMDDLKYFVEQQKEKGIENNVAWVWKDKYIYFEEIKKEALVIPSHSAIDKSLEIAHELVKIV